MAIDPLSQAPPSRIPAGDTTYDSSAPQTFLLGRGTTPVIANTSTRWQHFPFDRTLYRRRNLIELSVSRFKNYRHIATRYDKLAVTCDAVICFIATVIWWSRGRSRAHLPCLTRQTWRADEGRFGAKLSLLTTT